MNTKTVQTAAELRYERSGYGSKQADFDIVNENEGRIASTPYESHAAYIVRACNAYDDLVAALRGMLSIHDSVTMGQEQEFKDEWIPKARAALAKAGVK